MNKVYRVVFNRALGVLQVVSELGSAQPGSRSGLRRSLRPHRLAEACALLLATGLAGAALPVSAATCVPDATHVCGTDGGGANGGVGGTGVNVGGNGAIYFASGSDGAGVGGGQGGPYLGSSTASGGSGGQGGGNGGPGSAVRGDGADGGGAGGGGLDSNGLGSGGGGGSAMGRGFGGGGGGGGGLGQQVGSDSTIALTIQGGNGGAGGNGYYGGGGGGGGAAVLVDSAVILTASSSAVLVGGTGGNAGMDMHGFGGGGGGGGAGALLSASAQLINGGTITGGNGANGVGTYTRKSGGSGGDGVALADGAVVTNTGSISGGQGGYGADAGVGAGGVGMLLSSNATLVNSGTITGGLSGNTLTDAAAILFTGTGNTLQLLTGSDIIGTLELAANSGASFAAQNAGLTLGNTIALRNGSTLNLDASTAGLDVTGSISGYGNGALTLSGSNLLDLGAVNVASVQQDAVNAARLNANVTTSGAQTWDGQVALGRGITLLSTGNGNIGLTNVDGGQALEINTGGVTSLGNVGQSIALASLSTDGGGSTALNGNVTTTGAQVYGDAASLGGDAILASTSGGEIRFFGTLNGPYALTLSTAGGTVLDNVGSTSALASLTTDGGGNIVLNGNVTTTGAQGYGDSVTLGADAVVGATSSSGSIFFSNTVDGAHALTVITAGDSIGFFGTVGGFTALTSLNTLGGGSVFLGGRITTTTVQDYDGAVVLYNDATLQSTGGWGINAGSTLDGAYALVVNTAGVTTFGTVGGARSLDKLTTDAAGSTVLNGNVFTTGAQTYNDAVTLGADATLASSAAENISFASTVSGTHALTVNTDGAATFGGTATLSGLAVTSGTFSANALDIGSGGLSVATRTGGIGQGGAFTVAGTSRFTAGASAITLTNAGNDFTGAVSLGNSGANDVSIADANGLLLGDVAVGSGTLDVRAVGISQAAVTTIVQAAAAGAASFDSAGGVLTLANAGNDFTDVVNLTGGTTKITDTNALTLGTLATSALTAVSHGALDLGTGSVNGSLVAQSNNGAISQTGALTVSGATSANAGSGDITLANAGNDFGDIVNLSGGATRITDSNALLLGTLDTGNLTVISGGPLGLGDGVVGGNLSARSSGDMVQRGALSVLGTTTLDAGTGAITLTDAGNDFSGDVSLGSGDSVALVDRNDLDIAALTSGANADVSLIAGGTLTLSPFAIDAGTGALTLASNGGSFATAGDLYAGAVSLTGRDGVTLGHNVTGTTVTLDSTNAAIVQTAGVLRASTLTGSSGTGNVALTSAGNAIDTLGDFSAGNFNLLDSQALAITGALSASGDITLDDSAGITVTGSVAAGGSTTLTGGTSMSIGNGGTLGSLSGDVIDDGLLAFDHSDAVSFAGAISGSGQLEQVGSGTLALDGASSAFAGSTRVTNGTLLVGSTAGNGATLGGDVIVDSGATLGGHGAIGGDVAIAGGAHLAPGNSIGTLTIGGDASFAQGSVLDFEFGAPAGNFQTAGAGDSVVVGGNLTLNGAVLNVADAGGMGPGLYRIFSWGGTLTETNGGIVFGTVPGGETLSLQTLVGQINLLDTTGMALNFWNGNGLATASALGGGDGTWSTTSTTWTDANGSVTAAMQPQPGFAIFGGAAGTVTLDSIDGAVSASGLQFASDGYTLQGDTLTLVGNGTDAPVIRVGDGSGDGAGYTATIDNVLAGSDGLAKTDAGTLVLTAANSFSGGLAIEGGELSVSSDVNLGDAGNLVTLDGGLLQVTGTGFHSTVRGLVLGSNGGGFDIADAGNVFTVAQTLGGSGAFAKAGEGTLVLTADNTFTGGTTISAGTLQLGNGGTSGMIVGNVVDNGTLAFDRSDAVTFAGTISGTGELLQQGAGTTILTASNSFTGATVIADGTLQLGNGGTTGSISGDVVDNGVLDFNRSDAVTFGGAISGNGDLMMSGTGVLTLNGDSSTFAGNTDVRDGTLLVGGVAGNGAALGGNVTVDSAATLGGHGSIGGNVDIAGGARLAPGSNSIGTLTIGGDLTVQHGVQLDYEFGAPGADFATPGNGDNIVVGGNLTLNGAVLNVADAGDMGPGLYRIFSWGGTLTETNGGIVFGTVPGGETLSLQTLVGQINLLDTTGMALNFWNGNGLATSTAMGGGDGTWSTTSTTWTDANAAVSAAMQPQPGFAIFGGAAGVVTLDNIDGAVSATGLQFASDGYTLQGDTLTLVGNGTDAPVIRVGDGSGDGAGYTATIANVLAGSDGLAKTDAGTLVLTAANTFSGGLAIAGGELSVSSDVNLGDAGNLVTLDGGLLQVTGTGFHSTVRGLVLGSNGGGFDIADAGNVFTVAQALGGSGAFAKAGEGTLVLAGVNTFAGGTTISAGTLQLGNGGTSGMIVGNVVDNGTLAFDRSDAVTFAGTISGTGRLLQQGAGSTILTASNSFTGGTVITDGTLQLGNGGTSGSIFGGVVNNGTLAFDRSDAVTFAGTISGNGALLQHGDGLLVLNGDSSAFAGSTDVQSGTLVVGGVAGNGAVLGGDVHIDGGATLAGWGEIGGDVVNAGTLSPGMGLGALTIGGDYTQTAGGSLTIDAQPDGQADRLVVGGNASLDGSALVLAADGQWTPLTEYTILTAGGDVSGTFGSATSSLLFLDPVLNYDAHAVRLSLQRNNVGFASVGTTPNQRATAAGADTLGFGNAVYDAITTLDATTAPQAFDALSGELHASVQTTLMEDSRYVRDAMHGRLDSARGDGHGHGLWVFGWNHWARNDTDGNAADLRSDGNGVVAGVDMEVGEGSRIGVMGGVGRASVRVRDRFSKADVDSRHLGVYGRMALGGLQLQAGAARSWNDVDSRREVAFTGFNDSLRGDRDAHTTQAYLDGSHDFTVAHGTVSPFLGLAHVQVRGDGFTETGGDAALQVDPAHTSRTYATAGVRGAFAFADAWRLQGSLGWSHAMGGDTSPQVTESFVAGGDAFVISGAPIADNSVTVEAGLGYQATSAFRIDANYVGRFASDARDQGASLTLAWAF